MAVASSIREFCKRKGVPFTAIVHRTAYTAQEEAAVTHVPGRYWAKTVVCFADDKPVLAVLPAHYTVDLDRLRDLCGARTLRLATEAEMAPLFPDCEPGAMPPFGPLYGHKVFVDANLAEDPEVVFNAGTHTDAIRMRYRDFARLTEPKVGQFGRRPGH